MQQGMTSSVLIENAREWVIQDYPYNNYHLLKALEWLDRIAPDATPAMRLATLTHDMERAYPGADQPVARDFLDAEYYAAHADRSARIVGQWLREHGADEALVGEVERLIRAHETGGWPEADLVQAADSLSFLETNVDLFLIMIRSAKRTAADVQAKFGFMYDRIRVPRARDAATPLLENAIARLTELRSQSSSGQPPTN
jgi:hypothetical protein